MQQPRPLVYHVATSVDGYIARSDGSFDFFPVEGDHVADYIATLQTYGAVIMGRKTYEVGLQVGVTDPYPFLESYVISRSMSESPHPHVRLHRDTPESLVQRLKQTAGSPIYLSGGAKLAGALFARGQIDRLVLKQNPVLLGGGIPLAAALPGHIALTLHDVKRYESGVVLLSYDVSHAT